jgi:hypothetical protein
MSLVAALASWLRGGRYVHEEQRLPGAAPGDVDQELPA